MSAAQGPLRHVEIVRRVLEFIQGRLPDAVPVAAVARAAGVSRSHLCRIFKRATGIPVKRFLTRLRVQAAKTLLREGGVAIHQVARRVGFRDPGHFDRVFRQWEGQTPSRYRRRLMAKVIIPDRRLC